jgi:hydrogenase-4 component F
VRGVIRILPWTGGFFLMATLAITGTPPFSIFQSEFLTLSAALAAGQNWSAFLLIAGLVTIFAGFLVHMAKMNLGEPHPENIQPVAGRPWKIGAMILVASVIIILSFWLPAQIYQLVQQTVQILGGAT